MTAILKAIQAGFSSNTVLNQVKQKWPQWAHKINAAQYMGYTAKHILHSLAKDKENDPEAYQTEYEQTLNRDKQQKRAAALGLVGTAGTAGAIAAGAYSAARRGQAIQPTAILPAQRQQLPPGAPGATINVTPRPRGGPPGLPAPTQALPPPTRRSRGRQPPPAQPAIPLGGPKPEEQLPEVPELKTLQHKKAAIGQMYDLATKGKTGGNTFLKTANKLIKTGTITDVDNFSNFYNWWNATEGQQRGGPLVEYEKFRVQTRGMFQPPAEQELETQITPQAEGKAIVSGGEQPIEQPIQTPEMAPEEKEPSQIIQQPLNIRERVQQAAFAERPELKRLVDTSFKDKEFAIPTYRFAGEPEEEFKNRRIINEAIKKAAGELQKGKSFLEYGTIPPEILGVGGLSTAEDVLRFMAGIPNVLDPLLDEDEKQELYDSLLETGQATVEGLRPSAGERAIHGAPMTPNMVWNLLLTLEPRLYKMERPKAIKGATKPGEKMDTTGFRRYLTHAVYGVLSGKTIGPDLSEKIAKISQATATVDSIVKAAEDGNFNKVMREIERLSEDDEAFFALFDEQNDDIAASFRGKKVPMKPSAADTRFANELEKKLGKKEEVPKVKRGD